MNRAEKIEEIRESYLKKERKILKPILQLLKKLKIGPDGLSYSAAITTALFFISVIFGYFSIATILILIYVLLDKLDGALARYLEEDSQSGILTDFITNITSTLLITLSFEVLGLISWVHVVLFVYLYAIIYGFRLVKERTNKTITFWIVGLRTLLVVGYLTILVTNINLIDELFVILIITLISA
ncbi:hypothetical protein HON01_06655, partial [Candidatus Woesearchaeota archaeon]|nr:hypothetical protein [Candidatus Woesearchaeota archaeon]